jgi:hypothetical protein
MPLLPKPKTYNEAFSEAEKLFSKEDYNFLRRCDCKTMEKYRNRVITYIHNAWVRGNDSLKVDVGILLSDKEIATKIWERIYNEAIMRDVLE